MKTPTSKIFVAALALVLGLGCGPEESSLESGDVDALKASRTTTTSTTSTTTTTTTYALRSTDVKGSSPVWKSSYFVTSTYEVFFGFDLPSTVKGHHSLTVFVKAPGGASYQRMDVKFSTDVAPTTGAVRAEKLADGSYRVWTSMPVAGTAIEQYGLVGSWSAAAHLDGASTATSSAAFELQ